MPASGDFPRDAMKRPELRKEDVMSKTIYIEISTTERQTHIGGTTLEEHRDLMAKGFYHDRLANQYRKTTKELETS
jgi:hypothetical protein